MKKVGENNMDQDFFKEAMLNEGLKPKGIRTRISKANKAINILNQDFDSIIKNDDLMYKSLIVLQEHDSVNQALQNTLRKYYFYKNKKEFPRLSKYNPIESHGNQLLEKNNKNKLQAFDSSKTKTQKEYSEFEEEEEQFKLINEGKVRPYSHDEISIINNEEYTYKPEYKNESSKLVREKTNPRLKATRIEIANYLCEINSDHITFTNKIGKHQYLECHHIIPMNAQKDFPKIKLDHMFNLIAVCPICHAQVHYASEEERKEMFYKMVKVRKSELLKYGFDAEKMDLIFNSYYSNK